MEARRISIRERIHRQHEIAARMATEKVRGGEEGGRGGLHEWGGGGIERIHRQHEIAAHHREGKVCVGGLGRP